MMPSQLLNVVHRDRRRAFTLPEMLAVIAIIIIVLSLLLPSFGKSKESVWSAECANNQHQTSIAMNNFKASYRKMPNASELVYGMDSFYSGGVTQNVFRVCPADKDFKGTSYGVNPCITKLKGESAKVVMLDSFEPFVFFEGTSSAEWLDTVAPRHFGKQMNVLYYGGHVETAVPDDLNPYASNELLTRLWKPSQACDLTGEELGCGCTGKYYTGHWAGETATRIDTSLHMPFGGAFFGFDYWNIPLPGSNTNGWNTGSFGSGTWTASVKVPESGSYTFHLACDNEAWLYVDGAQLIHRNTGGADGVVTYQTSAAVSFTKGQIIDVEVRLRELTPGSSPSHVSIKWESSGTALENIPCEVMQPG